MSSKEHADRLAHAIDSLEFVDALNAEFGNSHVQVLCRVRRGAEAKWAKVVNQILLAAENIRGAEHYWVSHICRLYFLRDDKMVYGWHIAITSNFMSETLSELIRSFAQDKRPAGQLRIAPSLVPPVPTTPIRRPAGAPEADAKGNPKVPAHHRVEEMPMAGLDPDVDRNQPTDDGRGVFGMYSGTSLGTPFKPPGGGGRVGSG